MSSWIQSLLTDKYRPDIYALLFSTEKQIRQAVFSGQ